MSPSGRTHYDVLGLAPNATAAEIKAAWRRAARDFHPDRGGSDARFHLAAEAYEVLSDPARRADYDRRLGRGAGDEPHAARPAGTAAHPGAGAAAASPAQVLNRPPQFSPDFSPSQPPVLPLALAGRQVHGEPRRPGVLQRMGAAGSRWEAEQRTVALLEQVLLPDYPSARLVSGLRIPDTGPRGGMLDIGHVVMGGYRMAVIGSAMASSGHYRWDGSQLRTAGRAPGLQHLPEAVRTLQARFGEFNVAGWLVLHDPRGNPFEPVIDYPPQAAGTPRSAPADIRPVNAGTLGRALRRFFSEGPQPAVVRLPVLGALIEAADR